MKVCIVGAGAIGGLIGTRLAAAGRSEVSAIARGTTLAALREHGWRLRQGDALIRAPRGPPSAPRTSAHPVVIAVKGPALAQVAQSIGPLLAPRQSCCRDERRPVVVLRRSVDSLRGHAHRSVDRAGRLPRAAENVIGCVVHAARRRLSRGSSRPGPATA
jgi:2-dehydropantoate 2-reductase